MGYLRVTCKLGHTVIVNVVTRLKVIKLAAMAASLSTSRDWLRKDNEIQFFFHASVSKPLYILGVEDVSRYTIQVEAKFLRSNSEVSSRAL